MQSNISDAPSTTSTRQVPIHSFTSSPSPKSTVSSDQESMKGSMQGSKGLFMGLALAVIIAGAATGVGIGKLRASTQTSVEGNIYQGKAIQQVAGSASSIKNGDVFGSSNEKDFKDSADGFMVAGGIDGEGSQHLLRPGGDNQTVYLTSSVTDLSKFEGMEVKVWGETFQGQKAGWLMDVGRVEIVNTQGKSPSEK